MPHASTWYCAQEKEAGKQCIEPKSITIEDMLLDPNNYRFHDLEGWKRVEEPRYHERRVQQIALAFLQETPGFEVAELKDSIRTNGFVPLEQIVVRQCATEPSKYVVVEGNRRVAAIRWLLEDDESGACTLSEEDKAKLRNLEVLILDESRPENKHAVQVLMAIRHVSGIKEWGAYQQARLIVELLEQAGASYATVAERLGMSSREVARRFRASRALQQMESDEEYGDFAEPRMYAIFHEAVAQPLVREWLGWDDQLCRFGDKDNLGVFYSLICPSDGQPAKIAGYEDVRTKLKQIIQYPKALYAAQDPEKSLAEAHQVAVQEAGIAYNSSSLETAINAALKALDEMPVAMFRSLANEQIDLLKALSAKIQQTLDDLAHLQGQ